MVEEEYYPIRMSDEALRQKFAGLGDEPLIREIIRAEIQRVRVEGAEERTLTRVWYAIVKPVLARLGVLDKRTNPSPKHPDGLPTTWRAKTSDVIVSLVIGPPNDGKKRKAVLGRETSYEELAIVDNSKKRKVGSKFPHVILTTEKDSIWDTIEKLADLYGCSCLSSKGQPSYGCAEHYIKDIMATDEYQEAQQLIILGISDFDPAGYIIFDSTVQQIKDIFPDVNIVAERIGITPDQLTPEERSQNVFEPPMDTPKDRKKFDDWFVKTGGVDGQRYGLELDSLPIWRLRGIFADKIAQKVDMSRIEDDTREAFLRGEIRMALAPWIETETERLIALVKSTDEWAEVKRTSIPASAFKETALQGSSYMSARSVLSRDIVERVRGIIKRALK